MLAVAVLGPIIILIIVAISLATVYTRNTAKIVPKHLCADSSSRIIQAALASDSVSYSRLAEMTDKFGPRLSGTKNLEDAIDWLVEEFTKDNFDNVRKQEVMVPTWRRNNEHAEMRQPVNATMRILGLGGSIATPQEGLLGEVEVVASFDDLTGRCEEMSGKFVLFNVPFTTYSDTVQYRVGGAVAAAKCNATAALVRSVTPLGFDTPHTGSMYYSQEVEKIPTAAVTVNDAQMIQRMRDRGETVEVFLYMEAETLPDSLSHNVMAEITGSTYPKEVIVIGGHIDSWDVGRGAMDDGGGVAVCWEALRVIHSLGLKPLRTIRVVGWTNEENGAKGAAAYLNFTRSEEETVVLALESDGGVFKPQGFAFGGTNEAFSQISAIAPLLTPLGSDSITHDGGYGTDISPLVKAGAPGVDLIVNREKYFWYHHSDADRMEVLDSHEMTLCGASVAVLSYCVADAPTALPRS